eukprot:CAMPEP_0174722254 /NCGR_PEP_ID=MMETSP1094-20130205/38013_1 /TAXON_ID=156173 /ORGANISM="Chrysochromulina brevifilum, Strain UTEX LB 985" /LENGTH=311 /DNA_ID=CAMNT_0015923079 /DNA_START=117 /DNA_END=1052 /DNA_ORIENTATION=-
MLFKRLVLTPALTFAPIRALASAFATPTPPLVSAAWLKDHCAAVKIVDASWYLPAMGRNGHSEYSEQRIPGAVFFDIDATDDCSDLPHMLPSEAFFSQAMGSCGVSNEDHVVIYDGKGIFSAPRLWWMLQAFGHDRVSVLDGGLPAWMRKGYPTELGPAAAPEAVSFSARLRPSAVTDAAQVLAHVGSKSTALIVDARPANRFEGSAPEPRASCRSGHIPGSRNVPFVKLLDEATGTMLPAEDLEKVFAAAGVDVHSETPIINSCGSGVTAAVVQLAMARVGRVKRVSLYDGSWSEWGSDQSKPLATGPQM